MLGNLLLMHKFIKRHFDKDASPCAQCWVRSPATGTGVFMGTDRSMCASSGRWHAWPTHWRPQSEVRDRLPRGRTRDRACVLHRARSCERPAQSPGPGGTETDCAGDKGTASSSHRSQRQSSYYSESSSSNFKNGRSLGLSCSRPNESYYFPTQRPAFTCYLHTRPLQTRRTCTASRASAGGRTSGDHGPFGLRNVLGTDLQWPPGAMPASDFFLCNFNACDAVLWLLC